MRVAIQGYTGSYHALAAVQFFGTEPAFEMCESFPALFAAMESHKAEYALMAIENSLAGSLLPNYALLRESGLSVVGEIYLRIHHCLLALKGQKLTDITEVRSHPMALLQCRRFFKNHPGIVLKEDIDTALVAEQIHDKQLSGVGAIAGEYAGQVFDMDILAKGIEDNPRNFTRFLVLRNLTEHPEDAVDKPDKASLSMLIANQPGSLSKVLEVFTQYGINLTHIQSSPVVGAEWEYYMHMDVEFTDHTRFKLSINEILPLTLKFYLLGEYKRGNKQI